MHRVEGGIRVDGQAQWQDGETGLYYLRARQYDPATGRFTSADPLGYGGGDNLYAYAENNPVARTNLTRCLTGRSSAEQVAARKHRPAQVP